MFLSNISFTLILCVRYLLGNPENEIQTFYPRVVNGWPAKLGDVPYQLAFKSLQSRFINMYSTFCGGTIIGPDKVLSAAHCFEQGGMSGCRMIFSQGKVSDNILRRVIAVAGNLNNAAIFQRQDSMDHGQWRRLRSMTIPQTYKFPKNDIAVGFTRQPFVFNSHVNYIPYATVYRNYVGKCLVSGYGRLSHKHRSEILMAAHLEVFSSQWCTRLHRKNMRKFVCTSHAVSDVQKGDSGGPLVCMHTTDPAESSKGIVIGVVSGNRYRSGSFFTRVSSFNRFISACRGCGLQANVCLVFLLYCRLIF